MGKVLLPVSIVGDAVASSRWCEIMHRGRVVTFAMLPSPCRVLIVEDEFTIAMDLAAYVENLGCEPVGPAGSVAQALVLEQLEPLTAAIVDFNLRGQPSTPIIRALVVRGIPVWSPWPSKASTTSSG